MGARLFCVVSRNILYYVGYSLVIDAGLEGRARVTICINLFDDCAYIQRCDRWSALQFNLKITQVGLHLLVFVHTLARFFASLSKFWIFIFLLQLHIEYFCLLFALFFIFFFLGFLKKKKLTLSLPPLPAPSPRPLPPPYSLSSLRLLLYCFSSPVNLLAAFCLPSLNLCSFVFMDHEY